MADKWQEYVDDPRTVCKYGKNCYQKNPQHRDKFKHPPNIKRKNTNLKHTGNKRAKAKINNQKSPKKEFDVATVPVQSVNEDDHIEDSSDKLVPLKQETKNEHQPLHINIPKNITYFSYSIEDVETIIQNLFLVKMPSDFYKFYECLKEDSENIEETLKDVKLQLIGPFDLLMGKLPILEDKELYLVHWRYYYDPPEFQVLFL